MVRTILLAIVSLVLFSSPSAYADAWTLLHDQSRLSFAVQQQANRLEGHIAGFETIIILNPDDLATAKILVDIDMSTASLGNSQQDQAMAGPVWFAVADFPTAHFESERVRQQDEGNYIADGTLTLRGVRRPLSLSFDLDINDNTASASGQAEILRTDWGVGTGQFANGDTVALTVTISFELVATR